MYTCLPIEHGVIITVNNSNFFIFKKLTHFITDLGSGNVRVSRRLHGIHELWSTHFTNFVDTNGDPVAESVEELAEYLDTDIHPDVESGEGVSIVDNKVSIVAGGPSTLGGYKVGTGLVVDGEGRLSASATSEVTKVLANELEMLNLQSEPLRPYRVIRLDTNRLYYLNAGDNPSVLLNWFVGPSIENSVISFNGRAGAVGPEVGDYNADLVPIVDKNTSASYKFVIVDGELFTENITTTERLPVRNTQDLLNLQNSFNSLNDTVTNPSTGINTKLENLIQSHTTLNATIHDLSTGIEKRLSDIESRNTSDGLVFPWVNNKIYKAGQLAVINGKRMRAIKDTTLGTIVSSEWTADGTRANHDPIVLTGGAGVTSTVSINNSLGLSTRFVKGSNTAEKIFNAETRRERYFGTTSIENADPRDIVLKFELPVTTENFAIDNATKRLSQTSTPTVEASGKDLVLYNDLQSFVTNLKGSSNGLAPLGADSKVPINNLPSFLPKKKKRELGTVLIMPLVTINGLIIPLVLKSKCLFVWELLQQLTDLLGYMLEKTHLRKTFTLTQWYYLTLVVVV